MTIVDESTTTDRNVVGEGQKTPNGVQFIGPAGWIFVTRGSIKASKDELLQDPLPESAVKLYKSSSHMGNFFESIRSRKDPICPAEIGHRSIPGAHPGVFPVRRKQAVKGNPEKEEFPGDNAKDPTKCLVREQGNPYAYTSTPGVEFLTKTPVPPLA